MFPKAHINIPLLYAMEHPKIYTRNIFEYLQEAPWEVKRNVSGIPVCLNIKLDGEDSFFIY